MSTLKDLLDVAIVQEQNAQKLYQFGVDMAKDEETKEFFRQLAEEEKRHENLLYNIRETGLYETGAAIDDPEILRLVQTSHGSNDFEMSPQTTITQLLEIAMQREQTAKLRYQKAAELAQNEEVQELLRNLSLEEENHRLRVEKYYKIHKGLFGEEI